MATRRLSLAVLLTALLLPGVIAYVSGIFATEPESLARRAPFLVAFLGLLLGVYWFATRIEDSGKAEIGFRRSGFHSILFAIPLTLFFIFVFGPVAYAFAAWLGIGGFEEGLAKLQQLPAWYLALSIVIVAGGEEWLYRGYAIERIEAMTGSVWIASLASLAAFALVHLPLWGPGPALTTLFSGAILTVLYVATRDVLMLILAHVATDLYGLILAG